MSKKREPDSPGAMITFGLVVVVVGLGIAVLGDAINNNRILSAGFVIAIGSPVLVILRLWFLHRRG